MKFEDLKEGKYYKYSCSHCSISRNFPMHYRKERLYNFKGLVHDCLFCSECNFQEVTFVPVVEIEKTPLGFTKCPACSSANNTTVINDAFKHCYSCGAKIICTEPFNHKEYLQDVLLNKIPPDTEKNKKCFEWLNKQKGE